MEKQTNKQTLARWIADFFQKFRSRGGDDKNRVNPIVILAIAAAALTLVFIKPGAGRDGAEKKEPAASSELVSQDEYVTKTERELRDILSKISERSARAKAVKRKAAPESQSPPEPREASAAAASLMWCGKSCPIP